MGMILALNIEAKSGKSKLQVQSLFAYELCLFETKNILTRKAKQDTHKKSKGLDKGTEISVLLFLSYSLKL